MTIELVTTAELMDFVGCNKDRTKRLCAGLGLKVQIFRDYFLTRKEPVTMGEKDSVLTRELMMKISAEDGDLMYMQPRRVMLNQFLLQNYERKAFFLKCANLPADTDIKYYLDGETPTDFSDNTWRKFIKIMRYMRRYEQKALENRKNLERWCMLRAGRKSKICREMGVHPIILSNCLFMDLRPVRIYRTDWAVFHAALAKVTEIEKAKDQKKKPKQGAKLNGIGMRSPKTNAVKGEFPRRIELSTWLKAGLGRHMNLRNIKEWKLKRLEIFDNQYSYDIADLRWKQLKEGMQMVEEKETEMEFLSLMFGLWIRQDLPRLSKVIEVSGMGRNSLHKYRYLDRKRNSYTKIRVNWSDLVGYMRKVEELESNENEKAKKDIQTENATIIGSQNAA